MEEVLDVNGVQLALGDRVKVGDGLGTVRRISDFDVADYDDERMMPINPAVTVVFDDGDEDDYSTFWTATGPWDEYGAPYQCDEVEKVTPG